MANVYEYDQIKFKYRLDYDGSVTEPNIYLCNRQLGKKGQVIYEGLSVTVNFASANECSFQFFKYLGFGVNPLWGQLKDTSVILIEGFGYFEVSVPGTETDTIVKNVEGKSLQETELGQCYCTLQINTEDDVARTGYNADFPTLFYRTDGHTEASLLHRVLTYAPHYSIGHVDDSLKPLNRIFSCENTSVWDFLNQVSEEIGCIFICDPYSRTINAFDLSEHCNKCNGRHIFAGVCHGCKSTDIGQGYGRDVSLYIDTENLAEEITLSGDKDSLKNCFKLEGGDDVLTNRIGERLLGNTNYIWAFSDEMYNEMSDALRTRYMAYISYASRFQDEFNSLWAERDRLVDDTLMWEHTRFPEPGVQNYTPAEAWGIVANKITYTCISSKFTTLDRLSGNILSYVKLVLPSGYGCRFQINSDGTDNYGCTYVNDGGMDVINTWWGYLYIYLKNCIDDSGNDIHYYNTGRWQLSVKHGYNSTPAGDVFGNDYFLYLKQQLDIALARLEVVKPPKYDTDYKDGVSNHLSDSDYYKNYFREYSIAQLSSWCDAYDKCSVVIYTLNQDIVSSSHKTFYYAINSSGTKSSETIYDALLKKYMDFKNYIETVIKEYQGYVKKDTDRMKAIDIRLGEINAACNIENYLGKTLYNELLSFKREEVYSNPDFISDGLDDAQLMVRIEEFIETAKEELAKACHLQYTATVKMGNLLSDPGYRDYYKYFVLGNYIRARFDGSLVKMRLTGITFDFDSVENINVTFSDIITGSSLSSSVEKALAGAKSMATSFGYIKHQSTSNDKRLDYFNTMFKDGLNATKMLVMNADNLSTVIDTHGILTRQYNYDTGSYDPCQLRITNGTIAFTDNGWQTISAAFGKIIWNNQVCYGIIAEKLIGQAIIGNTFEINNESGTYTINDDGFKMANNGNSISLNAKGCSFIIEKQGEKVLSFTPEEGLYVSGKIRGGSININDKFIVDEDGNVTAANGNFSGKVTDSTVNIKDNLVIDENGRITAKNGKIAGWEFYTDGYSNYLDGKDMVDWLYSKNQLNIHGNNVYISADEDGAVYLSGKVYINGKLVDFSGSGGTGGTGGGDDGTGSMKAKITSTGTGSADGAGTAYFNFLVENIPSGAGYLTFRYGFDGTNYDRLAEDNINTSGNTTFEGIINTSGTASPSSMVYYFEVKAYTVSGSLLATAYADSGTGPGETEDPGNDSHTPPAITDFIQGFHTVSDITFHFTLPNDTYYKVMKLYYLEIPGEDENITDEKIISEGKTVPYMIQENAYGYVANLVLTQDMLVPGQWYCAAVTLLKDKNSQTTFLSNIIKFIG